MLIIEKPLFASGLGHIENAHQAADEVFSQQQQHLLFKEQQGLIVALSGSFDVVLDDGHEKQVFSLNRSYYGLYVPAGTWRQMQNFSTNGLALLLSSTPYNEDDYIRDYDAFLEFKNTAAESNRFTVEVSKIIDKPHIVSS